MRLLNINTFRLEEFHSSPPPYIALSHTWGAEEISLHELIATGFPGESEKEGWLKIKNFCKGIKESEFGSLIEYAWIDTCCIDRTSSAELSEAINSMYRWYKESKYCFAFLADVQGEQGEVGLDFHKARWFTRGFTLQELLAPPHVQFFDGQWRHIGNRTSLAGQISAVTKIPERILIDGTTQSASVAQKLSWAADRETTRPEDVAYCLLGLLDVNMPLLYGEGSKAFIRLQEEILKESDDQSIFAWDASNMDTSVQEIGALAPSPKYFANCGAIRTVPSTIGGEVSISNKGIRINLPLAEERGKFLAHLSCFVAGDIESRVALKLKADWSDVGRFVRRASAPVFISVGNDWAQKTSTRSVQINLRKQSRTAFPRPTLYQCTISFDQLADVPSHFEPWDWRDGYPYGLWVHNSILDSSTVHFPTDGVPNPVPEYLYAIARFEREKIECFAVELCFSPTTGRLIDANLVDLRWILLEQDSPASSLTVSQSLTSITDQRDGKSEMADEDPYPPEYRNLKQATRMSLRNGNATLYTGQKTVRARLIVTEVNGVPSYSIALRAGMYSRAWDIAT